MGGLDGYRGLLMARSQTVTDSEDETFVTLPAAAVKEKLPPENAGGRQLQPPALLLHPYNF
jgi:hypothetical protein